MGDTDIVVSETVILAESDHADLIRSVNCVRNDNLTKSGKRDRRKKSGVWSLFTKVDRDFALCNLCDIKFSYRTSTSNLKKHLHNRHAVVPPASAPVCI